MPRMEAIIPPVILRIFCAVALVLLSFAHQPVITGSSEFSASDFSSYTLPDGTSPVICATTPYKLSDKDGKKQNYYNTGCEACRLSSSIMCPEPPFSSGPRLNPVLAYSPLQVVPQFNRQIFPPSAPPQAPPVIL